MGGGGESSGGLRGLDASLETASSSPEPKIKIKKNLHVHEAWRVGETELMVAVNTGTRRMGEAWKFARPPKGIHC